jgi:hypothetical protein
VVAAATHDGGLALGERAPEHGTLYASESGDRQLNRQPGAKHKKLKDHLVKLAQAKEIVWNKRMQTL